VTISSTYIRACVAAGDMVSAAQALGRPHRVDGVVVRGDRRGRELGYPTANVETPPYTAVPADGVYAGHLVLRDPQTGVSRSRHAAAISVGSNPTFAGSRRTVEAYLLDFDGDLYGEHVGVEFAARLRPMLTFDGVPDLLEAMARDVVVVASDIPPNRELLGAEQVRADERGAAELIRAVLRDGALRESLLADQRRRAAGRGAALMARRYEDLYAKVLAGRPEPAFHAAPPATAATRNIGGPWS
jgi:glycosyltransferase involved in cell wall biosynthesis